ncbi:hypothetical protein EJ03DRAFT_2912 [Teratosphaeria nubilosa]|uniref:Uncharacterized protein n=1 Tax=Teratosphaeria nubilosa TaxID=161662 RepID=A0A6G1LNQ9_9PEZI|nr:hypothetical protein EJ03DRAFT_2912 [Teratosphaeria nubilosa]
MIPIATKSSFLVHCSHTPTSKARPPCCFFKQRERVLPTPSDTLAMSSSTSLSTFGICMHQCRLAPDGWSDTALCERIQSLGLWCLHLSSLAMRVVRLASRQSREFGGSTECKCLSALVEACISFLLWLLCVSVCICSADLSRYLTTTTTPPSALRSCFPMSLVSRLIVGQVACGSMCQETKLFEKQGSSARPSARSFLACLYLVVLRE